MVQYILHVANHWPGSLVHQSPPLPTTPHHPTIPLQFPYLVKEAITWDFQLDLDYLDSSCLEYMWTQPMLCFFHTCRAIPVTLLKTESRAPKWIMSKTGTRIHGVHIIQTLVNRIRIRNKGQPTKTSLYLQVLNRGEVLGGSMAKKSQRYYKVFFFQNACFSNMYFYHVLWINYILFQGKCYVHTWKVGSDIYWKE